MFSIIATVFASDEALSWIIEDHLSGDVTTDQTIENMLIHAGHSPSGAVKEIAGKADLWQMKADGLSPVFHGPDLLLIGKA